LMTERRDVAILNCLFDCLFVRIRENRRAAHADPDLVRSRDDDDDDVMAGSLRRKKRARASAGKKTHKVGVTTNFAKGRARVDTAAVDLPGAGATESWDVDATLAKNYAASGLASDPNAIARAGRNARDEDDEDDGKAEKVAAAATTNGDVARAAMGLAREDGYAAPKRLTPKQTRVVKALVEAHGDDLEAMRMDRGRNAMQHTTGQLLRLTESYHYWRERDEGVDAVRVDFRAPKKGKLRGKC